MSPARKSAPPSRLARPLQRAASRRNGAHEAAPWILRLYVAGQTPKSVAALRNLKRFCAEHLSDRYQIEVIDLIESPQRAAEDQILAIPTLVRRLPKPLRKIIGDLSQTDRVLVGFDMKPREPAP